MAVFAGKNFGSSKPARYVVFYNEAWKRWVGAIDISELISRTNRSPKSGYLGLCKGFYKY